MFKASPKNVAEQAGQGYDINVMTEGLSGELPDDTAVMNGLLEYAARNVQDLYWLANTSPELRKEGGHNEDALIALADQIRGRFLIALDENQKSQEAAMDNQQIYVEEDRRLRQLEQDLIDKKIPGFFTYAETVVAEGNRFIHFINSDEVINTAPIGRRIYINYALEHGSVLIGYLASKGAGCIQQMKICSDTSTAKMGSDRMVIYCRNEEDVRQVIDLIREYALNNASYEPFRNDAVLKFIQKVPDLKGVSTADNVDNTSVARRVSLALARALYLTLTSEEYTESIFKAQRDAERWWFSKRKHFRDYLDPRDLATRYAKALKRYWGPAAREQNIDPKNPSKRYEHS